MKKAFFLVAALLILAACSKKGVSPTASNTVTINGTSYPTVTIGNQVWTTVNYSGPGGYHSDTYSQFGNYYSQSQALAISLPAGWRVPTLSDYSALLGNFTSSKDYFGNFELDGNNVATLLSKSGWTVTTTNQSGFNVLPSGLFQIIGQTDTYQSDGEAAYFITSDASNQAGTFGFWVSTEGATVGALAVIGVSDDALSLRFVRDK